MAGMSVDVNVTETTVNRCLTLLEWYLQDHPNKTIEFVQEDDMQVGMIVDRRTADVGV